MILDVERLRRLRMRHARELGDAVAVHIAMPFRQADMQAPGTVKT